jgi:amicyanin
MMNKTGVLIAVIVIILLIAGGVYLSNRNSTPTETTGQQNPSSNNPTGENTEKVQIKSFAFSPEMLTIKAGTTVEWINLDSAPHTLVGNNGMEINSPQLAKGQTYTVTFTNLGEYNYHCSIHPSMKGKIIVK